MEKVSMNEEKKPDLVDVIDNVFENAKTDNPVLQKIMDANKGKRFFLVHLIRDYYYKGKKDE